MKARYKENGKVRKGPNLSLGSPISSDSAEEEQAVKEHPGFKLLGKSLMRKTQRQFDIVISDQELPQEIVETQVMNSLHSLKSLDGIVEVGAEQEVRDL